MSADPAVQPAPSAEARRLIDDYDLAVQARFKGAGDAGRDAADRALSAYVAGLEVALSEIRDMDWVDACLDPQWACRRAQAVLARPGAEP